MKTAIWIAAGVAALAGAGSTLGGDAAGKLGVLSTVLAGSWDITEQDQPSEESPLGAVALGQEIWAMESGGIALTEHYQVKLDAGPTMDFAAVWWDATAPGLRGIFCASFVTQGCSGFSVSVQGREIVCSGEYDAAGAHYRWRETFSVDSRERLTQILLIAKGNEELKPVITIHGTRHR